MIASSQEEGLGYSQALTQTKLLLENSYLTGWGKGVMMH